jgi:serine/threonine protein kinase
MKVGEGSYGCVFQPALKCIGNSSKNNKFVGKVFQEDDEALIEWDATNILHHIDKDQDLYIYPLRKCDVQDQLLKNCSFRDHKQTHKQLIMKFGGVPIDTFCGRLHRKLSRRDLIDLTINLFIGIKKMLQQYLVHQDIKMENILTDEKGNVRLIDFGFMTSLQNFATKKNVLYSDDKIEAYYVNPPEYRFHHANAMHDSTIINKEYKHLSKIKKITKKEFMEQLTGLLLFLEKKKGKTEIIHYKSDIYSLGLVLYELEEQYCIPEKKDSNFKEFQRLLSGMTHLNPVERFDIDICIQLSEKIILS